MSVKAKVSTWKVGVIRADGTEFPTFHETFESESDADRVIAAGNQLLASA
jgi:hypothetical protein